MSAQELIGGTNFQYMFSVYIILNEFLTFLQMSNF